ncbi:MAG: DUF1667 domain-containing protein [Sphaerochaetaceae bacterium]|jgi:CxxC motif-containing protein
MIDEDNGYSVTGAECSRGEVYGKKELQNPMRTVSSTVVIHGATLPRIPVKTSGEIPKNLVTQAVRLIDQVVIEAPVSIGTVVMADILGTGIDFITTRSMEKQRR